MTGPPTSSPSSGGGRPPPNPAQIQKILDENSTIIKTISEYQNLGKHHEAVSYQVRNHLDNINT